MAQAPVELQIGGQSYRLVASAEEAELHHLAQMVDDRLHDLAGPARSMTAQSLLLVALKLAHELEEERALRRRSEQRSKAALRSLLNRIDAVLDESPLPPEAEASHLRPVP